MARQTLRSLILLAAFAVLAGQVRIFPYLNVQTNTFELSLSGAPPQRVVVPIPFDAIEGPRPIYFEDVAIRKWRHDLWKHIVAGNETAIGEIQAMMLLSPSGSSNNRPSDVYERNGEIDPEVEARRCKRYGYKYDGRKARRRIFWGSLLGDDALFTVRAVAAELFGICHTVSFVESNTTFQLTPRELRFSRGSKNWNLLTKSGLFGPDTVVNVDYYIDVKDPPRIAMHRQHLQRQSILERWRRNGMRPDDVAVLSDTDEVFTRDFLRALQICDVPQFRKGQDCQKPKVISKALIFESSPECVASPRKWHHPDALIGECVDLIGDSNVHLPPRRIYRDMSWRARRYGGDGPDDFEDYFKYVATKEYGGKKMYPLWNGADFRRTEGGEQKSLKGRGSTNLHTGFHFHNFFETASELRHKYKTYGDAVIDADSKSLDSIHRDLKLAVKCTKKL